MNNKKGFTLIELLAVIVVLAIVTVIATQSILPFMSGAGRDAFASEANTAINGAKQAMDLIEIGAVNDSSYTQSGNTYCFTIANLKTLGLFQKDDSSYGGTITVTKSGSAYKFATEMYNDEFYVKTTEGSIVAEDYNASTQKNGVGKITATIKSSLKSSC